MRYIRESFRQIGKIHWISSFGTLAVLLLALLPGQAFAQGVTGTTCNSKLQYQVTGPSGGWFVGDELTVTAALGAGSITGGDYVEIPDFGFAGDCQQRTGLTYHNCVAPNPANEIEYTGGIEVVENCVNGDGETINFPSPQSSFIDFIPLNGPIRIPEDEYCIVSWKFKVAGLGGDATNATLYQALSFPVIDPQNNPAVCNNERTTSNDRSGHIVIGSCSIGVEKQICDPVATNCSIDANWHDADTAGAALALSSGSAVYRAVITNNGSAAYVDSISIADKALNTTIGSLGPGQSTIVGGAGQGAPWSESCVGDNYVSNEIFVSASCRGGATPVVASADNQAWGICGNPPPPNEPATPAITIEKATNGQDADSAPGPSVPVGDAVTWTYVVRNTGDVTITGITASDNLEGAIICPQSSLAPNASMTCSAKAGTAVRGQYANLASVSGSSTSGPASDTDPSHYFGIEGGIDIEKATNGQDADTATGPQVAIGSTVTWTYVVTNTGVLPLTNIVVTDSELGPITCPATSLAVGADMTCSAEGTATLGQYQNTGTVTADSDSGEVTDSDDSHYIGIEGGIDIEKATNGEDADTATGPEVAVGSTVTWTYVVTNTGILPLTNIVVTDSDLGVVTCPANSLAVGADMTCSAEGTATLGQYENTGTVTADSDSGEVSDSDDSHYIGIEGGIDIEKFTNGEQADDPPGPEVTIGSTVTWTYVVTNTGDLPLTNIVVTDSDLGPVTCPETSLAVGADMTCSAEGEATEGQYENTGTVTADSDSGEVSDSDDSHYNGVQPSSLNVEKSVEQVMDNQDGTIDVTYRVNVSNTGGQIAVYDLKDYLKVDEALVIDDTIDPVVVTYVPGNVNSRKGTLGTPSPNDFAAAPGATLVTDEEIEPGANEGFEFTLTFLIDGDETTVAGANCNKVDDGGTNTGTTNHVDLLVNDSIEDSAEACDEFPLHPGIEIEKYISLDNSENSYHDEVGPVEPPHGAYYRMLVTNTGDIDLLTVTVSDPMLDSDYTFGPLAVGDSELISVDGGPNGAWSDLYVDPVCETTADITNVAKAEGQWIPDGPIVMDTNPAKLICEGIPEIVIVKEVKVGDDPTWYDANEPGDIPVAVYDPQVPVPAMFRITVTNIGTGALANVTLNDAKYGIEDYPLGTLDPDETVVIDSGTFSSLAVASICDGVGLVTNMAGVLAPTIDEMTDPASVQCVGQPAIEIVKEVSSTGNANDWHESVSKLATSDAFWRITVTNTGSADLENVTVEDSDDNGLIFSQPIGDLDVGETRTLVHGTPGEDEIYVSYLASPGFCDSTFTYVNTASVSGDPVSGGASVSHEDSATYTCDEVQVDLCRDGKPNWIKFRYMGESNTYIQDPATTPSIVPSDEVFNANVPDGPVYLYVFDDNGNKRDLISGGLINYMPGPAPIVSPGDTVSFTGTGKDGKVPPTTQIEIYSDCPVLDTGNCADTLLQVIEFHTSCSQPLNAGDQFGAIKLISSSYN